MVTWLKTHITLVLVGLVLTILPLVYGWYDGISWSPLRPHDHLIQNGLAYSFLILFTYVNHTIFVPRLFLAKRYRQYALIVVSCVVAEAYLPYRIEQWVYFKPPQDNTLRAWARQIFVQEMMLDKPPGFHSIPGDEPSLPASTTRRSSDFRPGDPAHPAFDEHPPGRRRPRLPLVLPVKLALFFLLGSISTLISISVQTTSLLHQIRNDQLQAELLQLKAQIQPHFLFNTLNSIYALAIRNDARTPDTIVKLAEFLRYIIRDANQGKVTLDKEVHYIDNYIDLQKARLRDAVTVDYRFEGETTRLTIAPLVLFSFIENAFKYGVSPDEESRIDIHLRIHENQLNLYVANRKVLLSPVDRSTGIGLQNTKERLRLLYPAAHTLTIDDTPTHYQVRLTLLLNG